MQKPLDVTHPLQTMDELLAEPDTARLRRLCGYNRDVRYVPCDSELLSQKLERLQNVPLGGLHWFSPEDS